MPISQSVRGRISEIAAGEPFLIYAFLDLGNRAAIDRVLTRLVRAGEIKRVVPGIYVQPEISARFGKVPISPEQVARAMVKARGGVIQMSGGEAAKPVEAIKTCADAAFAAYCGAHQDDHGQRADGSFQHAGRSAMVGVGTPAGPVVFALCWLGRHIVGDREVQVLKARLTDEQKNAVRLVLTQVPCWMADVLKRVVT